MIDNIKRMDNTVYNFDKIEFENLRAYNSTQLNQLPDIPIKFLSNNILLRKQLQDDMLIENISYELYESTDYWDALMHLNNINGTYELPVNFDVILERTKKRFIDWYKQITHNEELNNQYNEILDTLENDNILKLNYTSDNNKEFMKRIYIKFLEEEKDKNEKYRNIKYLSISDITDLIAELNKLKDSVPESIVITNNLNYNTSSDIMLKEL